MVSPLLVQEQPWRGSGTGVRGVGLGSPHPGPHSPLTLDKALNLTLPLTVEQQ